MNETDKIIMDSAKKYSVNHYDIFLQKTPGNNLIIWFHDGEKWEVLESIDLNNIPEIDPQAKTALNLLHIADHVIKNMTDPLQAEMIDVFLEYTVKDLRSNNRVIEVYRILKTKLSKHKLKLM